MLINVVFLAPMSGMVQLYASLVLERSSRALGLVSYTTLAVLFAAEPQNA